MIVLYIFLCDARERFFAGCSGTLAPPAYQRRIEKMQSASARARTMAGLWLVEQGLIELGLASQRINRLGFGPGGRPGFADGPFFSVSHSARLVACALDTTNTIGLDVEQRQDNISPRLKSLIAPDSDFYESWCAREATVKASGHVGLARIRAVCLDNAIARLGERDWHLARPLLRSGYTTCLATAYPIAPNSLRCIDCGEALSGVHDE